MKKKYKRYKNRRPLWPAVMVCLICLMTAVGIVSLMAYLSVELTLRLNGSGEMTLEYGTAYAEPGAEAFYGADPYDGEIEITGEVDTSALGQYTVTYVVRNGWRTARATRTVNVVDTQAPVITLTYGEDTFTEPGSAYAEEGYSAWDAVDGDLTAAVERVEADGVVTYTVADSSGNSTKVERTVIYDDRTAPELTLLGEERVVIKAGTAFTEPGYTATDNVDGDISVNVVVNSDYDIAVPGSYIIHYSVTDSYGNTAEADRELVIEETQAPTTEPTETEPVETQPPETEPVQTQPAPTEPDYSAEELWNDPENPTDKIIYLTFDDGPGAYTPQLLEVLEKYNVKVTFFVVGTACLEYLDDIADAGHSIGLHSNSHKYSKIYKSSDAFFADLFALQEKVLERTGITATLYRFPGGSSNSVSKKYCKGIMSELVKAVEEEGFCYFDWNVDSEDAGGATTANQVYRNVINGVKNRKVSVVLQHDVKKYSVEAVEKIIQWGLYNGYTFLPLTEDSPTAHHKVNN